MKIAITSASGQLGSAIVKALINEVSAENLIAIARTPEKAKRLGVKVRKGDYNSQEQFNKALVGIDTVLLVSGMDHPQKRIQQHRNVIDAAKANGVRKIVYTSIVGDEHGTGFQPIVLSNRQTETDIRNSGLEWVIGRNGIYIEPDLEYLDNYVKEGEIRNCAGDGKCAYTSREELGYAYAQMLLKEAHNGQTYNLVGEPIKQLELAELINQVYDTELTYKTMSVEEYEEGRRKELGDFLGTVIAGIYEGIKNGVNDLPSDYEKASGRPHLSALEMIQRFKNQS